MKHPSRSSSTKVTAAAVLLVSAFSAGGAHAGAPAPVSFEGVAVCDFETQEQIITWTLTNLTLGGVEIQTDGAIDGSALSVGSVLDTTATFTPSIVLSGAAASATSTASLDAAGLVSISLSAIQGNIDSQVDYTGSVTLAGCGEATTTTIADTTTSIDVEAPTTAAAEPIALPSTGSHDGTAVLAALLMAMGSAMLLVRRRRVRS